jgi:hypothetical protein
MRKNVIIDAKMNTAVLSVLDGVYIGKVKRQVMYPSWLNVLKQLGNSYSDNIPVASCSV